MSAAFAAPVGGLLFAMEEVSSFWSLKLGWMTFFCCMMATFTCDLFNSSFHDFHFDGMFGLFKTDKYIIFKARPQTFVPARILHIKHVSPLTIVAFATYRDSDSLYENN